MAQTWASNSLLDSASLYLREHAAQPVAWQRWDKSVSDAARDLDKPIFVSSGFSACHWCHVMAHEAFSDPGIAELMNSHFMNVKVDREERPEIDQWLVEQTLALGVRPGWPLNVLLSPSGRAIWAGTYYPIAADASLPGFLDVARELVETWRARSSARIEDPTARIAAPKLSAGPTIPSDRALRNAAAALAQQLDPVLGGRMGSPRFIDAPIFRFLWRQGIRDNKAPWRDATRHLLRRASEGEIHDHVGGGFFRYAVGPGWKRPHFEKMLADNAQILELLALLYAERAEAWIAQCARSLVAWLLKDLALKSTDGGIAFAGGSAAYSVDGEGAFYLWDEASLEIFSDQRGRDFRDAFGLNDPPSVPSLRGASVHSGVPVTSLYAHELAQLRALRAVKTAPRVDPKVVTDANLLLVRALSRCAVVFEQSDWLTLAQAVFATVNGGTDGEHLPHAVQDGAVLSTGSLLDHALAIDAALGLERVTGAERYLGLAEQAAQRAVTAFVRDDGFCRLGPASVDDLPADAIATHRDDALPSGVGVLVEALALLGARTHVERWSDTATRIAAAYATDTKVLWTVPSLLAGIDALRHTTSASVTGQIAEAAADPGYGLFRRLVTYPDLSIVIHRNAVDLPYTGVVLCTQQSCSTTIRDETDLVTQLTS